MRSMKTHSTTQKEITRSWHLINAENAVLGKISVKAASLLRGKHKPIFVTHLDTGDNVVIINAKNLVVTGNKEDDKKYYHYSGYPSGLRTESLHEVRVKKPEKIVIAAVKGMLPKNRLGREMIKKLHVFAEGHNLKNIEMTEVKL